MLGVKAIQSSTMLHLENLSLRRGPRCLFGDVNLKIFPGQKVGITGANGTGKSSLFSLLLDKLHADTGDVRFPREWQIAHVEQELPSGSRAAIEFILDGDAELRELEDALSATGDTDGRLVAKLHQHMESIDGYTARARAARLLSGLGFQPHDEERPVDEFSGGWRMRLNLGRALMCRSDLLLLDEPTNHLDLDTVIWLEKWLAAYQGTLLLITHDRDFLDRVVNTILHIERGEIRLYKGNYTAFERLRADYLASQQSLYARQQREIAHMRSYVDRFRAKATKARQAQSRLKALERMELIAPAHVDSPFRFSLLPPERNPEPLLRIVDAAVGYDEKIILNEINLTLRPGDRVGLLGFNGAGKSTLIRFLAGEIQLQSGSRLPAKEIKIGYFAQHQLDQLHPQHSPMEHLAQLDPDAREQDLRNYLGGFGFSNEQALALVEPFSGGEKSRLVLAMLVYQRPNLLLLDEPTNHLDIEMRQALAVALQDYKGAMVIVSHDRHLLRVTTDTLLLVNQGRVAEFPGDLDDYPAWMAERASEKRRDVEGKTPTVSGGHTRGARKDRKRREAEVRQRRKPLQNRIKSNESRLADLSSRIESLQIDLASPALYQQASDTELLKLQEELDKLRVQRHKVESDWIKASEELEAVERQRMNESL